MKLSDLENFELVGIDEAGFKSDNPSYYALKPIAPTKLKGHTINEAYRYDKQPVKEPMYKLLHLQLYFNGKNTTLMYAAFSEPQALAIKEAVNALMEYIVTGDTNSSHRALIATVNFMADKARAALRDNDE